MERETARVRRLEKQVKELEKQISRMEKIVQELEISDKRYRRSPYDKAYVSAVRVKKTLERKIKSCLQFKGAEIPVNEICKVSEEVVVQPAIIKELPTITVVIPTYKPNAYIEECISSVLNQDYDHDKLNIVISVNGANKGFADELSAKYKSEERIQIVYTSKAGAGAGRNYAKQFVGTEYMTYLDDDDYFTPGYLKELALYTSENVSVVCGRLIDLYDDGSVKTDTYINRAIEQVGKGLYSNYLKLGSHFSSPWAKLFRTEQIRDIWGDFDETVTHTEDVIFWVENIYKPMKQIAVVKEDSTEALVRRVVQNSLSRPKDERSFAFYISDRIKLIERFSEQIFKMEYDTIYKQFVLTKIDASTKTMLSYYEQCSSNDKKKAWELISESKCSFINKSLFAEKEAIAFCHNFSPTVDASAFVASKRLSEICKYIGEQLSWIVVRADMSKQRKEDTLWERFYSKYQYKECLVTQGLTYFNEEAQHQWGIQAFELVKGRKVPYIYSRSMWAGSHVAARLYKQKYPKTIWIAEFSDPIYMGTDNAVRKTAKIYTGEKECLNTFWRDIEQYVYDEADFIIFTNKNQRDYMLDNNTPINRVETEKKSLIWTHPKISEEYTKIISSAYSMEHENINVGYFGIFYTNRPIDSMFRLLDNVDIHLHIFTTITEDLVKYVESISKRIHLHEMVSHLEFLNIASRMDYVFLNDIEFEGKITPYLPSKLADYFASGTWIIGLVKDNTPMSEINNEKLLKFTELNNFNVQLIRKTTEESDDIYRSEIVHIYGYHDAYVERWSNQKVFEIADNLKNGIADYGYSIVQPMYFSESGQIRWFFTIEELEESRNTFYLYHRGLRGLYVLARAYSISKNTIYLELADKILNSFVEFWHGELENSEMLYNDHTQAERIINIVYFWHIAENANFNTNRTEAVNIVTDALNKLMGEEYYQKNHNHGIIVDRACLVGAYFLNEINCACKIDYVSKRLKEQVDYAFSNDGIHKENSIDYHRIVIELLEGCKNILEYIDHPYYIEMEEKLNAAIEYLIYVYKPNLRVPLFGDSKGVEVGQLNKIPSYIETYNNSYFQYVASMGKKGSKPELLLKHFPSGYVFMREHFNNINYQDATWISLKAGYTTRVHKHQDDLSICLTTKGKDIFVDAGVYSYMYGDSRKKYMESLPAHSTICIKNKPYQNGSGNGWAFKIQRVRHMKGYDHVMASSRGYKGVAIYRNIYYIRDLDSILIRDVCMSRDSHEYAQYFHLGTEIELQEIVDSSSINLNIIETPYVVTVKQIIDDVELNILHGSETIPMSILSTGFSKYTETSTLEYVKNGKTVSFITMIDIHLWEDSCANVFMEKDKAIIEKYGQKCEILFENTEPVLMDNLLVETEENTISIINKDPGFVKHTVYIYNEDKLEDINKIPYSKDNKLKVDVSNYTNATIVYFVSNNNGESIKGILGVWKKEGGKGIFEINDPILDTFECSAELEELGDNEYRFQAKVDERLKPTVSWWVYRNGSLYKFVSNNERNYQVRLNESGTYVFMCAMRNKYFGEFFFSQSDQVTVE